MEEKRGTGKDREREREREEVKTFFPFFFQFFFAECDQSSLSSLIFGSSLSHGQGPNEQQQEQ